MSEELRPDSFTEAETQESVTAAEPVQAETRDYAEESRQAKEATRRLKKRMIIVLCALVGFIAAAIPLLSVLDRAIAGEEETKPQKPGKPSSVIFVEPDYDGNIFDDPEYLKLDRDIYLSDGTFTEALTPKQHDSNGPAVSVLCDFVEAVINGDADAYNALFSDRYYAEYESEPPFTMQQLYDILITKIGVFNRIDEETGKSYTEYQYSIEYKIRHNDGTYRTDIGHDTSRPQYFQLTDRQDEKVLIDRLIYMYD